jgi:hypothetical protein
MKLVILNVSRIRQRIRAGWRDLMQGVGKLDKHGKYVGKGTSQRKA